MSGGQLNLFVEEPKESKLGHATITHKRAASILTTPTGFMDSYDYSLNPYSGCSFGCTYCYAAFFSRNKSKMDNWGYWVEVKENALAMLRKKRRKPIIDKIVYMSSVTDPYQPIERKLELTRQMLREFLDYHNIRLVIQTRAGLVTRDLDLLKRIGRVQVNMTITTDDEEVRKAFEPYCPSNRARMKAIKEVHDAGVRSCITMTPLLPVREPNTFALALKSTGITSFIIQPFHKTKGKFVAGTRDKAMSILERFDWSDETYEHVLRTMQHHIPNMGIGKTGFAPPL